MSEQIESIVENKYLSFKAYARLKAFSALVSQGAALIKSRAISQWEVGASFSELNGFLGTWSDGAHNPSKSHAGFGGSVINEKWMTLLNNKSK